MVVVTNRSQGPVRFHITAFAWDESVDGEMVLKPTNELMFFPALLTLNPNESRNLRVGTNLKPGATEKTYRLFVQQLPALATAETQGSAVGMVTRMGLPVFVEAAAPKVIPSLSALSVHGSQVYFNVNNTGTTHFRPEKIVVNVKNGKEVVHTEKMGGWYVLAGRARRYVVTLPAEACLRIKSLEVELTLDEHSPPVRAALGNASCSQ